MINSEEPESAPEIVNSSEHEQKQQEEEEEVSKEKGELSDQKNEEATSEGHQQKSSQRTRFVRYALVFMINSLLSIAVQIIFMVFLFFWASSSFFFLP